MTQNCPRVSIGLPVYNGENYLEGALESLLAQTFTNFELIISDNASIDRTEEICRRYEAQDARIRYYRNVENIGAAANFNQVFYLAQGEYFKWAAHDDRLDPKFLERAVAVLDQDASVVLCHARVQLIDQNDQPIDSQHELYINTCNLDLNAHAPNPHQRFWGVIIRPHPCYQVFGLLRTCVLKQVMPMGGYGDADRVLLGRLSLLGKYAEIPEVLFFPRRHATQSLNMKCLKEYTVWFNPKQAGKQMFPTLKLLVEHGRSVAITSLPFTEKLLGYGTVAVWLLNRWKWAIYDTRLRPWLKSLLLKPVQQTPLKA